LQTDIREAFFFPTKECFTGLWRYLKVGIPSAALMCLEFWCYELLTFISCYLSVEETATQIIVVNLVYIFYSFCCGIGIAASALVGK
jgi:Na+-driven multidrug efflux pump